MPSAGPNNYQDPAGSEGRGQRPWQEEMPPVSQRVGRGEAERSGGRKAHRTAKPFRAINAMSYCFFSPHSGGN